MNAKVLISIRGTQHDISEEDSIETIQTGHYRYIDNKHVISYQEIPEDANGQTIGPVQNILKISNDSVTLTKHGELESQMYFRIGEQYMTCYQTPYGDMKMNLHTTRLQIDALEDTITIHIDYGLEMNFAHVSDCTIQIQIRSLPE